MNLASKCRVIFITGTDTGVGKTLLTGMLLHHLRASGCHALAMKPFCSGGLGDVKLLQVVQDRELTTREVNPFYFREPLAPLVAARKHGRWITLAQVRERIRLMTKRCECLLIEGSGGLFVPLGEGYTVADLIAGLGCETIVVARNQLGTINHTLLTTRSLQAVGVLRLKVVLMAHKIDDSTRSNALILGELLGRTELFCLPHLGAKPLEFEVLKENCKKNQKTLASIFDSDKVLPRSLRARDFSGKKN